MVPSPEPVQFLPPGKMTTRIVFGTSSIVITPMLIRIIQRLTIFYVIVLTLLLELPVDPRFLHSLNSLEPTEGYKHLIAFTLLGFLVELSRNQRSRFFWIGVLFCYSVATEILQGLLNPLFHRTFDWQDIVQNILGVWLGVFIGYYCRPLVRKLSESLDKKG